MPRRPRHEQAGGVFHLTTRGTGGAFIFLDAEDRQRFLRILAYVVAKYSWECHVYCLMFSHYHLVVTTNDANLAQGMHVLNGLYAQTFNKRYERFGHLFAARYRSRLVVGRDDARGVVRYVVLNPVRSGIAERAEQWYWSSYGATLGLRPQRPFVNDLWVLDLFGRDLDEAREALRLYVLEGHEVPGPVEVG